MLDANAAETQPAKSIKLPYRLSYDGPVCAHRFKPGRGEAGWTVATFASVADRDAFMAAHPEAAMPCWRRIQPGVAW